MAGLSVGSSPLHIGATQGADERVLPGSLVGGESAAEAHGLQSQRQAWGAAGEELGAGALQAAGRRLSQQREQHPPSDRRAGKVTG